MRLNLLKLTLIAAYIAVLGVLLGAAAKQGLPPAPPNIYSGNVFIAGAPAPDGIEIFARVGDYQTNVPRPEFEERLIILTKDGKYGSPIQLVVQPPDESYVNKMITFYATRGFGEVKAEETALFSNGLQVISGFGLNFPEAPPSAPAATPTPTPTITPTPLLPIPGDPSVTQFPRLALIAGIVALAAGGAILFIMRRRNAF